MLKSKLQAKGCAIFEMKTQHFTIPKNNFSKRGFGQFSQAKVAVNKTTIVECHTR